MENTIKQRTVALEISKDDAITLLKKQKKQNVYAYDLKEEQLEVYTAITDVPVIKYHNSDQYVYFIDIK